MEHSSVSISKGGSSIHRFSTFEPYSIKYRGKEVKIVLKDQKCQLKNKITNGKSNISSIDIQQLLGIEYLNEEDNQQLADLTDNEEYPQNSKYSWMFRIRDPNLTKQYKKTLTTHFESYKSKEWMLIPNNVGNKLISGYEVPGVDCIQSNDGLVKINYDDESSSFK